MSAKQGGKSTGSVPLERLDVSPMGHYYGTRSDPSLTAPPVSLFYLLQALCPSHWCVCKDWGNKAVRLFMAAGTVYGWCVLTARRHYLSASRRPAHSIPFPCAIFHLESPFLNWSVYARVCVGGLPGERSSGNHCWYKG